MKFNLLLAEYLAKGNMPAFYQVDLFDPDFMVNSPIFFSLN